MLKIIFQTAMIILRLVSLMCSGHFDMSYDMVTMKTVAIKCNSRKAGLIHLSDIYIYLKYSLPAKHTMLFPRVLKVVCGGS